jgi:hypothetical protein
MALLDLIDTPDRLWDVHERGRLLSVGAKADGALVGVEGLPCLRLGTRLRFLPCDVLALARHSTEGREMPRHHPCSKRT